LVLGGHEHSYQRTVPVRNGLPANDDGGTVYVITGGGGGTLHRIDRTPITAVAAATHHYLRCDVRGESLTVTAVGADGEIIDRVTLTRPTHVIAESAVNLGSYGPGVAAGSLIAISGRALAGSQRGAHALPYPEQLGGVTVTWNGAPAALAFVSPYQIVAQLPYGISGPGKLRVANQTGFDDLDLEVAPAAPAIIAIPAGVRMVAAITDSATGNLIASSSPAIPGNNITIYAVGLGDVLGGAFAGAEAPAGARIAVPVEVQIGDTAVTPDFAGLTPGYAGLYQINVRIPYGARPGPTGLRIRVGGAVSEPATLFVGRGPG
jgi:uncharacterized protein (TIGR03437 family)